MVCQYLLRNIGPGILEDQIQLLHKRIEAMLFKQSDAKSLNVNQVKILGISTRAIQDTTQFLAVTAALFNHQQIHIEYLARSSNTVSERQISPQKLIFYRDNWFLDAYCHLRKDLRTFSIDKIRHAKILEKPALKLPEQELENYFAASYGIFSGPAQFHATLIFSAQRSRWIADEHWHPQQIGQWLNDGRYQLTLPFNDHRELLMDILKYGADVEVVAPEFLQNIVRGELTKALHYYKKNL